MKSENEFPETLHEAIRYFAQGDNALNFLVSMRWPDGKAKCPDCGWDKTSYLANQKKWKCMKCHRQFSIKIGTIMEDSPISLDKWLVGMWLVVSAKNGISSYELHRTLGITQKSAWFMGHRIRHALHNGAIEVMKGNVEVDETFIGAKARTMNSKAKKRRKEMHGKKTGPVAMTPVQGLLERSTPEKASRVHLKVIASTKKDDVQQTVREYVLKGSTVHTDELKSYSGLNDTFTHQVINHAECYARGSVHTNGMENFWCLLKRTIKGTYVNVEPFHLYRYLDEQAYRFNERKMTDSERFTMASCGIPNGRLTYKSLTGKLPAE